MIYWCTVLVAGWLIQGCHGQGTPLTDLCTVINVTVPTATDLGGNRALLVSASSISAAGQLVGVPQANGIQYDIHFNAQNDTISVPNITVRHTLEIRGPRLVFIRTELAHHDTSPWTDLFDVTLLEKVGPGMQAILGNGFVPGVFHPNITHVARNSITWKHARVPANSSLLLEYFAEPTGDHGELLPKSFSFYNSTVTFSDTSNLMRVIQTQACILRVDQIDENLLYQHGLTGLGFVLGLILGLLLIILIVFILLKFCRNKGCLAAVAPGPASDKKKLKEKGRKIVMDAKAAMKKGLNAIKDFSMLAVDESIILILSLKEKLQMYREIDNLDILSTIYVDTDIEKEQNDAAIQTSQLLIQSLRHNGDISPQTENKVVTDFKVCLQELDRHLEAEFKKAMEEVYKDLSAKNKERFSTMMARHKQEKADAMNMTRDSTDEEKEVLLSLLDQQHQTEENELTYILALEQNEEGEKLRKEFAIRKRMGIKEKQQYFLNNTCGTGQLDPQQADWLLKEHAKQQERLHRMYDEEISRQRMLLEEKLARRRALAHASEGQEDDHVEMLNTMVGHQVTAIQRMGKREVLSEAQVDEYLKNVKEEMLAVKEKMEKEKGRQEEELHKKLSQRKQQRLMEKKKHQEQEFQDFASKSTAQQTDGSIDPIAFAEGLLKLRSHHRTELSDLENEIDSEHFHELEESRNQIAFSARAELKEMEKKLLADLQGEGMSENQMNKFLKDHDRELNDLLRRQEGEREKQKERLRETLLRRQQEWEQRRAQEKQEQEELREHEAKVVNKLINSQMSISEAERDRILKEHEKQMVQLENSLTLNKLRQKRMLEDKLAQRRAQQLEKLQQRQDTEIKKQRRAAENNGEESDAETHRQEAALMKKYAERRIAVLQGHELNLEEELSQIRQEMTKERAYALKNQEERLGAMIAALQMQKAREMAQIEEQQKAINNLKVNLMDELTDRGVLSSPECERIIETHKERQEQLNKKLDSQRKKQERAMQEKLQERLMQREQSLLQKQELEMVEIMQASGSKTASKIRRALLMHQQMLQLEQFRNQMERETTQVLEDIRRQFEVNKQKAMQEQELQFIAGLVKVGRVQQEELVLVLQMLHPGKSQTQLQGMLDKIADKDSQAQPGVQTDNTLVERVRASQLASGLSSRQSSLRSNRGSPKKRLGGTKKRSSQLSLVSSLNEESLLNDGSKKKSRLKRGSLGAQGVNVNGGFESDDHPSRPGSAMRGAVPPYDDYSRRQSSGGYEYDSRGDAAMLNRTRGSLGGYQHNTPIDEEDYEYPRQDAYGDDFIGMGTGHSIGNGVAAPAAQGRLPPLQTQGKGKKKKKLLKKLAKKEDGYDDLL
ncbi:limbin-like [Haliotis cracherodii]|uniref:limbin-like n=1 Tax=Haliotis cracherodii TaxID=6455 RepID=UPI0039E9C493